MSELTDDEMARWMDFVRRWGKDYLDVAEMLSDSALKPDAWPRRFRLFRWLP